MNAGLPAVPEKHNGCYPEKDIIRPFFSHAGLGFLLTHIQSRQPNFFFVDVYWVYLTRNIIKSDKPVCIERICQSKNRIWFRTGHHVDLAFFEAHIGAGSPIFVGGRLWLYITGKHLKSERTSLCGERVCQSKKQHGASDKMLPKKKCLGSNF